MKCKQCNQEYEAKRATSQYCSALCRQQARRLSVTGEELSVTGSGEVSVTEVSVTASLQHYQEHPEMYATRTNPTLINWSKPMSLHQLDKAGLKANRSAMPGDHDYTGCCEQVDGKWQIRAEDEYIGCRGYD